MPDVLRPVPPPGWRERVDAVRHLVTERPWRLAACLGLAVVLLVGGVLAAVSLQAGAGPSAAIDLPRAEPPASTADAGNESGSRPNASAPSELVVHLSGAVARPGLVRLRPGARVADGVEASGGLRPDADLDRLNLAAPLTDGQRLFVPVRGQPVPDEVGSPEGSSAGAAPDPSGGRSSVVDLNTATLQELDQLPGVGPATAQAILDYRRRKGRFRSVQELLEVRGIGETRFAQLRPSVRV